ncbi:hypothetical protein MRX96_030826 [Rhipicephalus microplus]
MSCFPLEAFFDFLRSLRVVFGFFVGLGDFTSDSPAHSRLVTSPFEVWPPCQHPMRRLDVSTRTVFKAPPRAGSRHISPYTPETRPGCTDCTRGYKVIERRLPSAWHRCPSSFPRSCSWRRCW